MNGAVWEQKEKETDVRNEGKKTKEKKFNG